MPCRNYFYKDLNEICLKAVGSVNPLSSIREANPMIGMSEPDKSVLLEYLK